jgi:hypothetical protein
MFHDTGIPSPVPEVDFTLRSAAVAREFADGHDVPAGQRELVANAIAMHHTPDSVRRGIIGQYPRLGFKWEFAGLLRAEAKQVPRGRAWYLHRFAVSDLSIRLAPFRG